MGYNEYINKKMDISMKKEVLFVRMVYMRYVLHEFTVTMPFVTVDEAMEKLNLYGYYNLYYDQPIEQVAEENGYGVKEIQDTNVDLKVIFEEMDNVEKVKEAMAEILDVKTEEILYHLIETEDFQQPFPIIDLENGWYIKPTISVEEVPKEGRVIHFEFGSGLHETIQDCLRIILKENFRNQKVLDIGVGAKHVVSVDIEDIENEVLQNASLNGVENNISVIQGDVLSLSAKIKDEFDWIFVNISANEIKQAIAFISSHLMTNSKVILSGMVDWNVKEVIDLYEKNGYHIEKILHSNEWITLLVKAG
jgi:ribosomal protein L11 methyltransferase